MGRLIEQDVPAVDDDVRELAVRRIRRLQMMVATSVPESAISVDARRLVAAGDDPITALGRMCDFAARHGHLAEGRVGRAAEAARPATLAEGVENWREARRRGMDYAQPRVHDCPHPDELEQRPSTMAGAPGVER